MSAACLLVPTGTHVKHPHALTQQLPEVVSVSPIAESSDIGCAPSLYTSQVGISPVNSSVKK